MAEDIEIFKSCIVIMLNNRTLFERSADEKMDRFFNYLI